MRHLLPVLVFLAPLGLLHAVEEETLIISPQPRTIPAISLLPEGSVLTHVMLPRYDKDRKLVGVLKSEEMTLVSADQIFGTTVSMQLFNPDRTPRGRMDLAKALLDQKRGLLEANQPVTITSDRMTSHGTGLVFAFDQNHGFLLGPATTRITKPPATAMNASPSPALRATALLGAALLPLTAAPPPTVTPAEKSAIDQNAVSRAGEIAAENKNARTDLREILKASDTANKAATDFLEQADLLSASATTPAAVPAAKPLEVTPDPEVTIITCDGGIYFDPAANVLVYLKNVTVADPRFDLKGANELKVFFDKKEPKPDDKPKPPEPADPKKPAKKDSMSFGGSGDFGDPRRVIATGAVVFTQKSQDEKPPLQASGATVTFDLLTGEKIIYGGYPWVMQGTNFFRAQKPELILKIDKDFHFVTEGPWTTGMKLNEKDTKEKGKDNNKDNKEKPKP